MFIIIKRKRMKEKKIINKILCKYKLNVHLILHYRLPFMVYFSYHIHTVCINFFIIIIRFDQIKEIANFQRNKYKF